MALGAFVRTARGFNLKCRLSSPFHKRFLFYSQGVALLACAEGISARIRQRTLKSPAKSRAFGSRGVYGVSQPV